MTDPAQPQPFEVPGNAFDKVAGGIGQIDKVTSGDLAEAAREFKAAAKRAAQAELTSRAGDNKDDATTLSDILPPEWLDWVDPAVQRFCERSPESPALMAEDLVAARGQVGASVNSVNGVTPIVAGWTGDARDSFYSYFLVPFPGAAARQIEVIDELVYAIRAFETMLRQSRVDLRTILQDGAKALDALDDFSEADLQATIGIVSTLIAIFGKLPAPKSEKSLAVFSRGMTGVDKGITVKKGLNTAGIPEIIGSARDLVHSHEDTMEAIGHKMAGLLDDVHQSVWDHLRHGDPRVKNLLLPAEPDNPAAPEILDGDTANDVPEFQPPA